MNSMVFIKDIVRKFPSLIAVNIMLLVLASVTEAVAIFTLVPVADFLLKSDVSAPSFITKKAIELVGRAGLPVNLATFIFIFLVFNMLAAAFQIFIRYVQLKTKYRVIRDLIIGSFEDFFSARWYFFSSNNQGMLLNTFTKEIGNIATAFWATALLFASGVQLLIYLAVPFYLSWQVTVMSLTMAFIFVVPFFLLGKFNYSLGQANTARANDVTTVIQESFSLAKLIIGFGNQRQSIKMLSNKCDAYCTATSRAELLTSVTPVLYNPLGLCALFITLLFASKCALPLSEMAALLYSLIKIIPAIGQIGAQKNTLNSCLPSYEQFLGLRNSAKAMKQQAGTSVFAGIKEHIVVKDLSFSYPNHKPVLTDIDLSIPKGKMIAIVGRSGSGKTTLVDMLLGLHDPSSGKILIDGEALQDFDIKSYRQRIGYVPQDSILFNSTIRENLRWSKNEVNDDEIKRACIMANADEFIARLPHGYDTVVGDCGVRLSGGQRQRIALARAMLRKPELLILDEATSSLDTYSERLIQEAIENIAKNTTVVIIAHRLSTIESADYIYVLKGGRVIEEGTYSRLAGNDTEFREMIKQQALHSAT